MVTGWQTINGTRCYFADNGAWIPNQPDPEAPVVPTGWRQGDGSWYYYDSNGIRVTGWLLIDGAWYYFSSTGAMVTKNMILDGILYRFDESGKLIESSASPLYVESLGIQTDYNRTPTLFARFRNNLTTPVNRVDFKVYCFDKDGNRIYGYDQYDYSHCWYDYTIPAGGLSMDNYPWTLNGFEGARSFDFLVYQFRTANGLTIDIPEERLAAQSFTY